MPNCGSFAPHNSLQTSSMRNCRTPSEKTHSISSHRDKKFCNGMQNQAWERAYFALVLSSATSCMHTCICKNKHSNWSNAKDSHRTSSVFRGSSCSSTGEVTGRCLPARRSVSPSCVLNSNLRSRAMKQTMWKIGWQCKRTHTNMPKLPMFREHQYCEKC